MMMVQVAVLMIGRAVRRHYAGISIGTTQPKIAERERVNMLFANIKSLPGGERKHQSDFCPNRGSAPEKVIGLFVGYY